MEFGEPEGAARSLIEEIEARYLSGEFPVYELVSDTPEPRTLGDSMWTDGVTVSLSVAYGDPLARPIGPLVQVITSRPDHTPALSNLLLDECEERGLTPSHGSSEVDVVAVVDRTRTPARRIDVEKAWAAQLEVPPVVVTVVAIGWDVASLELAPVSDIASYLEGWSRSLPPGLD